MRVTVLGRAAVGTKVSGLEGSEGVVLRLQPNWWLLLAIVEAILLGWLLWQRVPR